MREMFCDWVSLSGTVRPGCAWPIIADGQTWRIDRDLHVVLETAHRFPVVASYDTSVRVRCDGRRLELDTVAAFAVADFLNRQEMQVNAVRMAALDMSRRASADFASDDALDKAFERVMPALLAQLNVEQLEKLGDSVGREEPKGSE